MEKDKYITIREDWFTRLDEIAMSVEKNGKVDMQVLSMLLGYINSAEFIVKNFQHPIILNTKTKKTDSGNAQVREEAVEQERTRIEEAVEKMYSEYPFPNEDIYCSKSELFSIIHGKK